MTQRTRKVASLVQQIVAAELRQSVPIPNITVTKVDVSPDLRHATVWLGIVEATAARQIEILKEVNESRHAIQSAVSASLSTKFVPRIEFKQDVGGEYA